MDISKNRMKTDATIWVLVNFKGTVLLGYTTPVSRFQICLLQCGIINIIDIISIMCITMNVKRQKIQDSAHPSKQICICLLQQSY